MDALRCVATVFNKFMFFYMATFGRYLRAACKQEAVQVENWSGGGRLHSQEQASADYEAMP